MTTSTNRRRIVEAAAQLVTEGGEEAASTRAVSSAAGVQAPAIYRLFGDKRGLLDAAAAHVFESYVATKSVRPPGADPVDDLRAGWDEHIEFGLSNPAVYALIYGQAGRGNVPAAAQAAAAVLEGHIARIARAGRLRVPERRAASLVHAAGSGMVLALIATPHENRDPELPALAREAVIAAITTGASQPAAPGPAAAAVTLRATLSHVDDLTAGERALLAEWLDRIGGAEGRP